VARVLEVCDLAGGGGHQCGGGEQAHAGHGQQRLACWRLSGQVCELYLELADAGLEEADLLDQHSHGGTQPYRQGTGWIGQLPADLLQAQAAALADVDAELATEAAQRVDTGGASGHPQTARSMQGLQCLLLDAFDAHRLQLRAAQRLDERRGVGRVGLVAPDVGAHVLSRQQRDSDVCVRRTRLEPG